MGDFLNRFYLRNGSDVNLVDRMGRNRVAMASVKHPEDLDEVKKAVQMGVNINTPDYSGVTAITHAVRGEHFKIAKYLASLNAVGHEAYSTMPSLEYLRTHVRVDFDVRYPSRVLRAISQGGDVDALDSNDYTPLMRASLLGNVDSIKVLVDNGASTEVRTRNGATALIIASTAGNINAVRFLLKRGADITAKTKNKSKRRFFQKKAKLDRDNITGGFNSLMMACSNGHNEVIGILLDSGMYINDRSENGFTPLMIAVSHGHSKTVKVLLDRGANMKESDKNGITAYMLTLPLEDSTIGRLLITHPVGRDLGSTFSRTNMSELSISENNVSLGGCVHPDNIRLPDGRCVHMSTREARRAMMHLVDIPEHLGNISTPLQSSGTCWFFSSVMATFVSDLAVKNSKYLRRIMIEGRKNPMSPKFKSELVIAFLRLNMMIQGIVDGIGTSSNITFPITSDERIVSSLSDNNVHRTKSLNSGSYPLYFVYDILRFLDPTKKGLRRKYESDYVGYKFSDSVHRDTPALFYVIHHGIGVIEKTLVIKSGRARYVADSVMMGSASHAISGVTLNNRHYIIDSNKENPIEIDWTQNLTNGTSLKLDYRDDLFRIDAIFYQLQT